LVEPEGTSQLIRLRALKLGRTESFTYGRLVPIARKEERTDILRSEP